jgi:hypothetical protein
MVLRLDRRLIGGQWRTTFTLKALEPIEVHTPSGPRSMENPFAIARIEYEGDGLAPKMYDRRNRLVSGPTPDDIRALGVPKGAPNRPPDLPDLVAHSPRLPHVAIDDGPAAGLVARAADAGARRSDLVRRLGVPVGRLRGLDRFVTQTGQLLEEVLVQPEAGLPVEINLVRGGALVSHARFDYETFGGGAFLRRRFRHEEALPDGGGTRLVTEVELTNISVSEGGR